MKKFGMASTRISSSQSSIFDNRSILNQTIIYNSRLTKKDKEKRKFTLY